MKTIKPFVKWAGGKGNLINQLQEYYPNHLESTIIRYIEPFLGGGAVLINILQNYNVKEFYAYDINPDLINCYKVIQNDVENLIKNLKEEQEIFYELDEAHRKEKFYEIRKEYNSYRLSNNEISEKRAAEFIFLNKTCFNGLYRVNQKGEFNVPFGKYKNPTICDENNLRGLSSLIKNVSFECGDYRESEKYVNKNTFIYLDPPYRPLSNTASFTSYYKDKFNDEDQMQLAEYFRKLDKKGAKLMLSNSNPKNVDENDDFFQKLYDGFYINEIWAKRVINSKAKGRGKISELLITNYKI